MNWRRTGNKEFPEEGQKCLIYFYFTKYSISEFNRDYYVDMDGNPVLSLGKIWGFSDEGGWLGEEDVLWMPIEEAKEYLDKKEKPPIPSEYINDKIWKKWDDPEKVYRYVLAKEDLNYRRNPENKRGYNQFDLFIPKGSKLGITCNKSWKNDGILSEEKYKEVWQCVYDDGVEKWLIYIAPEQMEEINE